MTAGAHRARQGGGFAPSVRGRRFSRPSRTGWILIGLVIATVVIDGLRGLWPAFPRGDLLYHWGLTHAILRGELPPGGPYQGLPAYYPPGFHLVLAAISAAGSISVETATLLLGFAWLPVLPIGTFALTRALSGRSDVALIATALTVFGGGFSFSPDRLWVNSLFLVGQQAYPIFPRDLVFGLLPWALLAFLRALDPRRGWPWAVVAGALLGAAGLIQVQLLLPIPIVLLLVAIAVGRDPRRARGAALAVIVTGIVAALAVAPWLLDAIGLIRRNGGIALDSAETLLPLRLNFWDMPREFGLLLPLAIVGVWLVLVHLRGADAATTGLSPKLREAPIVVVAWFLVPWLLAVLYDPGWPLEDALRPQRLWLISSQPGAILAAFGVVAATAWLLDRWQRGWVRAAVPVAIVAIATIPTVFFTTRLLFQTWTVPVYADLRLVEDRVPDMPTLLPGTGPRQTVLSYEDWSSLIWYQTGSWVVAVNPPGYAKLAFDPGVFTGHAQAARRLDVSRAFNGDRAALASVADAYDANEILLARRGDRWGLIDQVASVSVRQPSAVGTAAIVHGNGWDAVDLSPGERLATSIQTSAQPIDLEIRFVGERRAGPDRRVDLMGDGENGERLLAHLAVPVTGGGDWVVVSATVQPKADERVSIVAVDPVVVQSLRGFVASSPPAGWQLATMTEDAILLRRTG